MQRVPSKKLLLLHSIRTEGESARIPPPRPQAPNPSRGASSRSISPGHPMALRNLVAKMRSPAAAALRLPPPRVSPPAGAPRKFFSFAQSGQHGKGFNLETASEVEIIREADLVGKEIDETLERLSLQGEKITELWEDILWSTKLWIGSFAALELVLQVDSWRRGEK